MKVMASSNVFYYPDVMVTCDPPGGDRYYRSQPILIIEVTSPTTDRIDRNEKVAAYKAIHTLHEYVLIAQDQMLVELLRRKSENEWLREVLTEPGDELRLESVSLTLTLRDVYRNVK
jgi:Uma2 family endonuclease